MRKLYFCAFSGNSIISKFIKFWTRSSYSHIAYLYIDEEKITDVFKNEKMYLIEVWKEKGKTILQQYWQKVDCSNKLFKDCFKNHKKGTKIDIWSIEVEEDKYKYVNKFINNLAINKTKYDYVAIVSFLLRLKKQENNKYFCSEGCIAPLVNVNFWYEINPSFVSPSDFIKILQAAGGIKEFSLKL
jgi:hypothetical protein